MRVLLDIIRKFVRYMLVVVVIMVLGTLLRSLSSPNNWFFLYDKDVPRPYEVEIIEEYK